MPWDESEITEEFGLFAPGAERAESDITDPKAKLADKVLKNKPANGAPDITSQKINIDTQDSAGSDIGGYDYVGGSNLG